MKKLLLGSVLIALAPAAASLAVVHATMILVGDVVEDMLRLYERAGRLL
jgi:hypothetical protein